jgi:hypothetical protein
VAERVTVHATQTRQALRRDLHRDYIN